MKILALVLVLSFVGCAVGVDVTVYNRSGIDDVSVAVADTDTTHGITMKNNASVSLGKMDAGYIGVSAVKVLDDWSVYNQSQSIEAESGWFSSGRLDITLLKDKITMEQ